MANDEEIAKSRLAIGLSIKQLREKRRMTQQELGDLAGVGRTAICRLEAGQENAGLDTILALAKVLKVHPVGFFIEV